MLVSDVGLSRSHRRALTWLDPNHYHRSVASVSASAVYADITFLVYSNLLERSWNSQVCNKLESYTVDALIRHTGRDTPQSMPSEGVCPTKAWELVGNSRFGGWEVPDGTLWVHSHDVDVVLPFQIGSFHQLHSFLSL